MCRLGHKFHCRVGKKSSRLASTGHSISGIWISIRFSNQNGYARNRGIEEIANDVLQENRRIVELCTNLGFLQSRLPDDPGVACVWLKL